MGYVKRIFLFLVVNILVVTTITIVLSIFNVQPYISQYGIQYKDLLIFCLVWGMGGSLISLALSKTMAKWMMGVKVIAESTKDPTQQHLLDMVHRLAKKAHLTRMPEVGIFHSGAPNAFATGPTKNHSLVAVSSGLLEKMNDAQLEGVLAHELTHITNGDMVTMTLLQGIVNAFVMFLSRILAFILSGMGRSDRRQSYGSFYVFTIIFQILFMILGSLVVMWYSRKREYRADAGGAKLAGKDKMISALESLQKHLPQTRHSPKEEAMQTFKISTPRTTGWSHLFASHPPLEMRIAKLKHNR